MKFSMCVYYLVCVLGVGCASSNSSEKWRKIFLQPKSGAQTITIITNGVKRYIMDGQHNEIPSNGYIMVDISKVDQIGDAIQVCWGDSLYRWKISSAYGQVVEQRIDTTMYKYSYPLGEYGEPTSEGFTGASCGSFLIREDLAPKGDVKIKYAP